MTPKVAGVTWHQVLTMTAGFPADDINRTVSGGPAKDWVAATLAGRLEQPPGQGFAYSSDGSHLLSAILAEATGRSLLDYARDKLFDPLGIDTEPAAQPLAEPKNRPAYEAASFAWPVDPSGNNLGNDLLKISAPDMAKLGRLMLAQGRWDGKQIVSSQRVAASTRAQVTTTGTDTTSTTDAYGYHWWVATADGHSAFAACGFAGLLIEVVPDLDLVVVGSSTISEIPRLSAGLFLSMVDLLIAPLLAG